MFIKQLYTGCLSEAAYYIESEGEAAIIDPLRDIDVYLDLSRERKSSIKYIFETHFHADFVSGHLDLAKATGAPIIYGPGTETSFPRHRSMSLKLSEAALTMMRTSPGPGSGTSTSTTCSTSPGGPFLVTCRALIGNPCRQRGETKSI